MEKGIITVVALAITLTACGGGGSSSTPETTTPDPTPPVVDVPVVDVPVVSTESFYEVTLGTETVWYRNTVTSNLDPHSGSQIGTTTNTIEEMNDLKTEVVHLVSHSELTTVLYDPSHEAVESFTLTSTWDVSTGAYTAYRCAVMESLSSLASVVPQYAIRNEIITDVVSDFAECANTVLDTPQYTGVGYSNVVTNSVTDLRQVGKTIGKEYQSTTPFPEFANFSENTGLDVSVLSDALLADIDISVDDMMFETDMLVASRQDYWINSADLGVSTSHAISADVPYDYDIYMQSVYRNGNGDDSIERSEDNKVTWISQGGVAITAGDLL